MKKKKIIISSASLLVVAIAAIIVICNFGKIKSKFQKGKVDDWVYKSSQTSKGSYINFSGIITKDVGTAVETTADGGSYIGLSVGGAKDIQNFRENINSNYFPISTDITYEGIFYDYNFNTGRKNQSNDLFSPSYSYAVSKDPISGKMEYYMTVGLNSNIKKEDFQRKKLNLVLMLDISGSMESSMNEYYYDQSEKDKKTKSKMKAAEESINCLIDQLGDDDKFGVVLFDNGVYLGKEMNLVKNTDLNAIKEHILEIKANGGTNFSAGYEKSTELFDKYTDINSDEYENRIIVITDAMPNLGDTSKDGLYGSIKENADKGINTTFIGVGVDFNTELIESISKVKGANYYSVHNVEEFKTRMGEQFNYMVTPLVYDLKLDFDSDFFDIEQVYGSDAVNKNTGNIMNVNTLFPSESNSDGEVKGGIVLLKLTPKKDGLEKTAKLSVSYKDRSGKSHSNDQKVEMKADATQEYYENTGIRKAILLVRYVNVMKNWILYERSEGDRQFYVTVYTGTKDGRYKPEQIKIALGENERQSVKLSVSEEYKEVFSQIKKYIKSENEEIKDSTLDQEIKIIDKLIEY